VQNLRGQIPDSYRNAILTGDCHELIRAIPDESIDLVFTDPPYLREHLPLYGWLAKEAARVLKPGGFCLAMCGGVYLDEIMVMMREHLTYYWKYEIGLSGAAAGTVWLMGNKVPVLTRTKPLLAWVKGKGGPRTGTYGLFMGSGEDKRYHVWGQDEASTRYYIDCFSAQGDIVLDPFSGGGTTPAMCKVLQREWIAFEIEPDVASAARVRVAEQPMPLPQTLTEQFALPIVS
jgi:DNA modification methylase